MNPSIVSRLGCLALGAVFTVLSAGCDSSPPPLLRVGTIPFPGYEPLHLAHDLNYFGPAAHVRLVEYSASTQVLRAFRNRSIEAAALTLDETLELAQDVPDIRIVLVLDVSNGADAVLGRPGLEKMADLRGRRVGYEATALGAYTLARALEIAGLRGDEVTLVPVQFDEHEKVFSSGQVDAIVTFEPSRGRLLAAGARVLFSSAEIPGELLDVLVVHQAVLEKNPGAVAALVRGHLQALAYQRESPADAHRRSGARLNLTPEQTRAALRLLTQPDLAENRRLLVGSPPALRATAERLGAVLLKHQLLRQPPALDTLFDARPLERLGVAR